MSQKIVFENERYDWITSNGRSHVRAIEDKFWSIMTVRVSSSKKNEW